MELRNVEEAIRLGMAYKYKLQALLYLQEAIPAVEEDYKKHLKMEERRLEEEIKDLEYQLKML